MQSTSGAAVRTARSLPWAEAQARLRVFSVQGVHVTMSAWVPSCSSQEQNIGEAPHPISDG